MSLGSCNVCAKNDRVFAVPWDKHGVVLMREHFRQHHPGILLSAREVFDARTT